MNRATPLLGTSGPESAHERRREVRTDVRRPVKLFCRRTGRYLPAHTANLSPGGALLELDSANLLVPGQELDVGIAWTRRDTVLAASSLARATVVRSAGLGSRQHVAIAFTQRQELAAAG